MEIERLEISDVIIDYDVYTLRRLPVARASALERLEGAPRWARRVVEKLPGSDGMLDPDAVDNLLVTCHGELQRLWEELRHPQRVERLLRATVAALRDTGVKGRLRVVDVGCGPAFVLRWLCAHGVLAEEVDYVGADYHAALINEARRLAALEALDVELVVANAFTLAERADIVLSSGVLHHFRGPDLGRFFRSQKSAGPRAFLHFDIQPSWAAPLGAWLFHRARMRQPISRYDGTLSALRAHHGATLLGAAREESPGFAIGHYAPAIEWLPIVRTIHGVVGIEETSAGALRRHLAPHPMTWS